MSLVKLSFIKKWMKQHSNNNESLTSIFIRIRDQTINIDPSDIDAIIKYIYNCYGLDTSSSTSFEALRLCQSLNAPNIFLQTLVPSVPAIERQI